MVIKKTDCYVAYKEEQQLEYAFPVWWSGVFCNDIVEHNVIYILCNA